MWVVPKTTAGRYSHCNAVEAVEEVRRVMAKTPTEEELRLDIEELAELLRTDRSGARLRAALATHHLRPEDMVLGGLIETEEETMYGVFVNRAVAAGPRQGR